MGTPTLTVVDNRTGARYELPIADGAIRAADRIHPAARIHAAARICLPAAGCLIAGPSIVGASHGIVGASPGIVGAGHRSGPPAGDEGASCRATAAAPGRAQVLPGPG